MNEPLFPLGDVVITAHAKDVLDNADVEASLRRHAAGDWGGVSEADRKQNDLSLAQGMRLFSAYNARSGQCFWIITEHDRLVTTILLPDDY